jgi:hypothetical protein
VDPPPPPPTPAPSVGQTALPAESRQRPFSNPGDARSNPTDSYRERLSCRSDARRRRPVVTGVPSLPSTSRAVVRAACQARPVYARRSTRVPRRPLVSVPSAELRPGTSARATRRIDPEGRLSRRRRAAQEEEEEDPRLRLLREAGSHFATATAAR